MSEYDKNIALEDTWEVMYNERIDTFQWTWFYLLAIIENILKTAP